MIQGTSLFARLNVLLFIGNTVSVFVDRIGCNRIANQVMGSFQGLTVSLVWPVYGLYCIPSAPGQTADSVIWLESWANNLRETSFRRKVSPYTSFIPGISQGGAVISLPRPVLFNIRPVLNKGGSCRPEDRSLNYPPRDCAYISGAPNRTATDSARFNWPNH